MRGIFSSAPAPIRLLVGSQILLLVQAFLLLRSAQVLDAMPRAIVLVTALAALAALIAAIRGEPDDNPDIWWRCRHVR